MSSRTISMEDAGELSNYLPLPFRSPKEQGTSPSSGTPSRLLSQKDTEICLGFDLAGIADRPETDSTRTLHEVLKSEYGSEE